MMHDPFVLVDDVQRWAYIPIPRCCSNSVMRALEQHWGLRRSVNPWTRRWPLVASTQWLAEHPEYHVWAVIRDPWSRVLSVWAAILGWRSKLEPNMACNTGIAPFAGMRFDEFVRSMSGNPMVDPHLYPLTEFLRRGRTRLWDSLISTHNVDTGWAALQSDYGLPELPHENASEHASVSDYYTPETVDIIASTYRESIELFGFTPPEVSE